MLVSDLKLTHNAISFEGGIVGFKLILVPEYITYIDPILIFENDIIGILVDVSYSMKKELQIVPSFIREIIRQLPPFTNVRLFTFSKDVKKIWDGSAKDLDISKISFKTSKFTYLGRALKQIDTNLTKLFLFTDGKSLDKVNFKPEFETYTICIGKCNEKEIKKFSKRVIKAKDPSELPHIILKTKITDVSIKFPENLIFYKSSDDLTVVDGKREIIGLIRVSEGKDPVVLDFVIKYKESNEIKEDLKEVIINRSKRSNIDLELANEIDYFNYAKKFISHVSIRPDLSAINRLLNELSTLEIITEKSEDDIIGLIDYMLTKSTYQIVLLSTEMNLLQRLDKEISNGRLHIFYVANYEPKSKEESIKIANLILSQILQTEPKSPTIVIIYDFDKISKNDDFRKIIIDQLNSAISTYDVKFLVITSDRREIANENEIVKKVKKILDELKINYVSGDDWIKVGDTIFTSNEFHKSTKVFLIDKEKAYILTNNFNIVSIDEALRLFLREILSTAGEVNGLEKSNK
jgi:hypothetical protein